MTPVERERARVLVERAKAGQGRKDLALVVEYMSEPGPIPDPPEPSEYGSPPGSRFAYVGRWHGQVIDPVTEAFLDAYGAICLKFDRCLGHEDGHGGFEVHRFDYHCYDWVRGASLHLSQAEFEAAGARRVDSGK